MRTCLTIIVVLLLMATSLGCTEDFEPKSAVLYTRVLGVRADHPRLSVGQRASLDALVVSLQDDDEFSLVWEVCPFTGAAEDNFPCIYPPELPPQFAAQLQGSGEAFAFTYDLPFLFLVDAFCSRSEELRSQLPEGIPLPDCTQGYPARVRLSVTNDTTGETIAAVKTLYLMPSQGDVRDNDNPVLAGLQPDDDAGTARVGEPFPVRCDLDPGSLETFTRADDDNERQEEVLFSWYVRNGTLDKDLTLYSELETDTEKARSNEVTPEEAGDTTVWCIARDGRGGVDWRRLDIAVEP